MNTGLSIAISDLIKGCEAVLVDMDGCMIASGQPLPGAAKLIDICGGRLWLVSNNSSHSAGELSQYLSTLNLEIPARRVLPASELVLSEVQKQFPRQKAMILARRELRSYANELGIIQCDTTPGVIVLTRDLDLDYNRLSLAIKHLSKGVALLVANPDLTHPDLDGDPVPETGSLLALLKAAVPELEYKVMGKPQPYLFQAALERTGASASKSVMIGDNPRTDCDGAAALGIRPLLIGQAPDAIAPDIASLLNARITP